MCVCLCVSVCFGEQETDSDVRTGRQERGKDKFVLSVLSSCCFSLLSHTRETTTRASETFAHLGSSVNQVTGEEEQESEIRRRERRKKEREMNGDKWKATNYPSLLLISSPDLRAETETESQKRKWIT